MNVEITKMSSRGQIVVPQGLRNELGMKEGAFFAIFGGKDTIILKKLEMPSKEILIKDIGKMAREGKKRAENLGLKESDVPDLIHKIRRVKG